MTMQIPDNDHPAIQSGGLVRVLFVCLGNICRSPLAEGVFREAVGHKNLDHHFQIDSAGTGAWHVGEAPDRRMQQTARRNGVSLADQRARQFQVDDLRSFEHIFAMDRSNLNDILFLDGTGEFGHKVRLFREIDPEPGDYQVPDPYYGSGDGFQDVFNIVKRTVDEMLSRMIEEYYLT